MRIFIFIGRHFLSSFALEGERHVLGSSTECDIRVEQPHIAPKHCEFIRSGDSYLLRTLVQTMKPVISERPCHQEVKLNPDYSKIRIGPWESLLEIYCNPPCWIRPEKDGRHESTIPLETGKYTFGSASACDIVIKSEGVEGHHCDFILDGMSYAIKQASANAKIVLNGECVKAAALKRGDMVDLGTVRLSIADFDPIFEEEMCCLDDSWHWTSKTCGNCANGDWALYECKIYGKSPEFIWNDEIDCPDRIIVAAKTADNQKPNQKRRRT